MQRVVGLGMVLVSLVGLGWGCGPDTELIPVRQRLFDVRVVRLGADFADLAWESSIPGDTRVDYSEIAAESDDTELESLSDQQYVPLWYQGGVAVEDPDFVSVSNTRFRAAHTEAHRIRLDDLSPGTTYAATVSTNNGRGAAAQEYGVRLLFTTLAAEDG